MFNKQNFCHVASNNRNEQKAGIFVYRTTDNLQTVTTPGYFNEKLVDINLHDLIIHEQTDNADKTKVVYNILCVTERTLDNVGTQTIFTDWEKALVVPTKLSDLTGDVSIVNPTNGQQLVYNSTTQKWENAAGGSGLPDQTGNNGKFLTTDGTDASWATVDALPDQTGNAGKFLTTDGTNASWGDTVNAPVSVNNTNNNGRSLRFVNYVSGNTTIMGMDYYYSGYSQGFVRFDSQAEALILRGKSGGSGDGQLYISGYGGWFNTPSYRYWGDVSYPWSIIYVKKLNNGADINVPNQAGTMVVADYTDATEGQVLTLDSSLNPVWGTLSGSVNLTEPSTVVVPADAESDQIINKNYVDSLIQAIVSQIGDNQILQIQTPTAQNNYTWYRLYANGWVEQGGIYTSEIIAGSSASVTLPITMVDTNYTCLITAEQNSSNWSGASLKDSSKSTIGFQIYAIGSSSGDKIKGASWEVKGMADTATKYIYTVPGTYTLTLEPGTYEFDMSAGGGGGAAALGTSLSGHTAGASGGTGSYGSFTLTVTQTDTFTITVGGSGAGATKSKGTAQGGAGGTTTISSTDLGDFVSLGGGGGGYAHATSSGDTAIKGTRGTFTTTLTTHSLNNGVQGGSSSTASGSASYGNTTNPLPYDGYGFGGGWMYDMGATQMSASNGGNGFVIITKQ